MRRALVAVSLGVAACAGRPAPAPDPILARFRERATAAEIATFERLRASADEQDRESATEMVLFEQTDEGLFDLGITQVHEPLGPAWSVAWSVAGEDDVGPVLDALAGLPAGLSGGLGCFGAYVPREMFFEARRALLASPGVTSRVAAGTLTIVEPRYALPRAPSHRLSGVR